MGSSLWVPLMGSSALWGQTSYGTPSCECYMGA